MQVFSLVTNIPTNNFNRTNSVLIKNAILLNILYNTFNLRDTYESLNTTVSSTNKIYRHDITALLLKVALTTIIVTLKC
jgi:hypothetical protein